MSPGKRTECLYCGDEKWLSREQLNEYGGHKVWKYECSKVGCGETWLETTDGKIYPLQKRLEHGEFGGL